MKQYLNIIYIYLYCYVLQENTQVLAFKNMITQLRL